MDLQQYFQSFLYNVNVYVLLINFLKLSFQYNIMNRKQFGNNRFNFYNCSCKNIQIYYNVTVAALTNQFTFVDPYLSLSLSLSLSLKV